MTNYIKGEFDLKVKGKDYPCKLSMNALYMMSSAESIKMERLDEMLKDNPIEAIVNLCYYGLKNAALKSGKKFNVPKDVVAAEVLDENDLDYVTKAVTSCLAPEHEGK